MKYSLIALDLDGTLLGPDQRVSVENAQAIAEAQAAGVFVVPCTGRGWCESAEYLCDIPGLTHGIFNTGAIVAEMSTGRAVDLAKFEPHLIKQIVEFLAELPDAVLVFQDLQHTGRDYLVCGNGGLTKESRRWFESNEIRTQTISRPGLYDLHHSVRVSMVALGEHGFEIERRVAERFGEQIGLHCFGGVPTADREAARFMVEIFAAGVDKWRGVRWLADQRGVAPEHVACIGDEINDLAMIQHAGLGIAMANAIPQVAVIADRTTLSCTDHGVAHAIYRMLEGDW